VELSISMPLISFVAAGLGAFVGAYLRKKGENLATHEDIGRLVDQVSAVTKATKEIEAKISDEVWDRQRLWELKRDAFFALVKAESEAKHQFIALVSNYDSVKNDAPDSQYAAQAKTKAGEAWLAVLGDFEVARAQAALVCGREVEERLNSLAGFLKSSAKAIAHGESEFTRYNAKLNEERDALFKAVRKELASGNSSSSSPTVS
jgi:hypothetical protein